VMPVSSGDGTALTGTALSPVEPGSTTAGSSSRVRRGPDLPGTTASSGPGVGAACSAIAVAASGPSLLPQVPQNAASGSLADPQTPHLITVVS